MHARPNQSTNQSVHPDGPPRPNTTQPTTAYEFFYSQAPGHMRSFTQSLNLLTTALGTWLCIPIVYLGNANPDHQV